MRGWWAQGVQGKRSPKPAVSQVSGVPTNCHFSFCSLNLLRFEHISKRFPGVQALEDVTFSVEWGHCHALLGENGAGKSTLGKILAGITSPDAGWIAFDDQVHRFATVGQAAQAGVGIVHQELLFCPNLLVAENLCLHKLPAGRWGLARRQMIAQARRLLAEIGLEDLDVEQPMANLSIAQEQLVQIAAAIGSEARILVFDEPTSSLGVQEVQRLFRLIRRLQDAGVTIIYVSHRLEEIFLLCQAVTVLRDGRHIATQSIESVDHDQLVRLMVGREVKLARPQTQSTLHNTSAETTHQAVRLEVRDFSSPGKFEGVSLRLFAGEILGLAGLIGAGRTEVAEAIFGLDRRVTGQIFIDGQQVTIRNPREALAHGLGLVPEDRKRHGLVLGMSVRENTTLAILHKVCLLLGWVDRPAERQVTENFCQILNIRTPGIEIPTAQLSGGNQQKIVLAKWLAAGGRVLLVDEPTRGVDVGAKQEIHELLAHLAGQGLGILIISSDLPELLALADRVVVLRSGRVVKQLTSDQADPETVLRWMAGLESTPAGPTHRAAADGAAANPETAH